MREHVSVGEVIVTAPMLVKPPIIVIQNRPVWMQEHVTAVVVNVIAGQNMVHIRIVQMKNRPV